MEHIEFHSGLVKVPFRLFKLLIGIVGALGFVALSWFMHGVISEDRANGELTAFDYGFAMMWVWICGLFFLAMAILVAVHIVRRHAFILGPEGLLDNSGIRPRLIPWQDVNGTDIVTQESGGRWLTVKTRSVALYYFPASDRWRLHPKRRLLNCAAAAIEPGPLIELINEMRQVHGTAEK